MRGYQEDFFTLYTKFQSHEARQKKGEKVVFAMNLIQKNLQSFDCLDVGCSAGVITSFARPYFKHMIGLDFDRVGIGLITEEQKKETLFIRGDAMGLPFQDLSFDAIICAQVYEHVPHDLKLFSEIERVIRPGGIVFFSGPNNLFPIELHYYLPFLQWLPEPAADAYLKITRKGTHFYERSRTIWGLRKILQNFDIIDMTIPVVRLYASWAPTNIFYKLALKMPHFLWMLIIPFVPNFNLILIKQENANQKGCYHVAS
jgi:2-polyprenyl-3-methyl-5-hydroxy-6-metoxy-1,4-benzoquinol methylase